MFTSFFNEFISFANKLAIIQILFIFSVIFILLVILKNLILNLIKFNLLIISCVIFKKANILSNNCIKINIIKIIAFIKICIKTFIFIFININNKNIFDDE